MATKKTKENERLPFAIVPTFEGRKRMREITQLEKDEKTHSLVKLFDTVYYLAMAGFFCLISVMAAKWCESIQAGAGIVPAVLFTSSLLVFWFRNLMALVAEWKAERKELDARWEGLEG